MRQTPEKLKELIKLLQSKVHLKSIVMTLAVLVVFVTTYVLILPAFTLDKEEAAEQGGIDVVAVEQQAEEEDVTPSEETEAEESAEPEIKKEAVESTVDKVDKEAEAAETKPEKPESKEGTSDVKLLTKDTELKATGEGFTISAAVGKQAEVPADTSLEVKELDENTPGFDYEKYKEDVLKALKKDDSSVEDIGMIRFYDISLESDTQEESVEPSDTVAVKIAYDEGIDVSDADNIRIVHFGEKKTEVLDVEATVNNENQMIEASFETDGFSVYAVVDDEIIVDESRMTLNFYNGDTKIATVYVKNDDDDAAQLEKIIYDPGAGVMNSGELFKGWILDKPNYTADDVGDKMDVAAIRAWAKEKANSNSIVEGETHDLYAMIYKTFAVAFKDEDGATIHSAALIFPRDEESVDYTINQPYTPKSQDEAFRGWYWTNADGTVSDPIVAKDGSEAPFLNGTEVTIKDNITFTVNVPRGYWLSFSENGQGASYTPPQFIQTGNTTEEPADPTRFGYEFGGWYTNPECTGAQFVFGQELSERTTLYAKWTPVQTAQYNVIIWRQNVSGGTDESDYDFVEAVTLTGNVGTTINTVTSQGDGNGRYARVNGVNKQYTGFHLNHFDQNVTIVPEGTSVVNVYYDRIEYTVRFYYARTPNNNNNRAWWVATTTNTGANNELNPFNNYTTWTNTNQNLTAYGPSTMYEVSGNNRHYYYTITALYGQDISDKWPRYDQFPDLGDYQLISWWMMHRATSWGGGGNGRDTVKGVISIMDEQLLGDPTSSNGNILIARYSNSQPNVYNYKIWKELPAEFDVPVNSDGVPKQTTTRNGIRYYLDDTLIAKANSDPSGIHQPSYKGFDEDTYTYRIVRSLGNNRNEYDVEMYYSRHKFKIQYMDGLYLNGNGVIEEDLTGVPLKDTDDIYYESDIHSYNKGGENYYEPTKGGYVFEGWYTDKACQHEAVFAEIPDNNVTVYAKWREIQYRVFLHPNVEASDTSLDLGGQNTSFRVDYGEKIAGGNEIHATRDDYDLIGWYTDEACTKAFNFDAYVLNDTTVTTEYEKTEASERDKYGDPLGVEGPDGYVVDNNGNYVLDENGEKIAWNRDTTRFWINNKLDLYAKWRSRIEGANGIKVQYDAGQGTNAPTDPLEYLDNSEATAGAASTPNNTNEQFMYWVVQTWNGTDYVDTDVKVYPGDIYTVLKANAKAVVTEWVDPDNEEDVLIITDPTPGTNPPDGTHTKIKTATYTVQLRAEYADKSAPTPTHIDWYKNYDPNEEGFHTALHSDKNLQINEAVNIWEKQTRDGYKFLGWARVETTDSESHDIEGQDLPEAKVLNLTKNDLFLTYHEDGDGGYYTAKIGGQDRRVSKVAADEVTPYHDMYAVWQKVYTVKVKKIVEGTDGDKELDFSFSPTINDAGDITQGDDFAFILKHNGEKEIEVPENALFSVKETQVEDFIISVTGQYTDSEGNIQTISNIGNDSTITIVGDTEITFKNSRPTKTIKVYKTDITDNSVPLKDAVFTINNVTITSGNDGYTEEFTLVVDDEEYDLTETQAPDGYNILDSAVKIKVNAGGVTYRQPNNHGGEPQEAVLLDGVYVVTVTNTAGVELPHTGGIGTTIFYILGSLLVIGCGVVLVARRRMGAHK